MSFGILDVGFNGCQATKVTKLFSRSHYNNQYCNWQILCETRLLGMPLGPKIEEDHASVTQLLCFLSLQAGQQQTVL